MDEWDARLRIARQWTGCIGWLGTLGIIGAVVVALVR